MLYVVIVINELRLGVNVSKSAVMVFFKDSVNGF